MKKAVLVTLAVGAVLVLLAVGGFFAVGLAHQEFDYETRVRIDRPVEEVWAVFTDVERSPLWIDGLENIENVSGRHLEPGSEWLMTFKEGGRELTMTETVVAVEAPRLYSFDMDNDFFTGRTEVRLSPDGDGTELSSRNTVAGKGLVLRSLLYLGRNGIRESSQATYGKLKRLVEGERAGMSS